MKEFDFDDIKIEALVKGVFDGTITKNDLPVQLYNDIAEYLKKGLYKGFSDTIKKVEWDSKDLSLLAELRENIYIFSGAKTYQQVRQMTDALTDDNGTVKPYAEFKEDALQIFDTYNDKYLQTEYNTAIAGGQMGALWNNIERDKDLFPFLALTVVEDDNTSAICEPLDGICLPVDDPFWNEYYPPNHFNCRTTVEQLDKTDAKVSSDDNVSRATEHADEHMSDMFKMNVGKDQMVFNETDHPYFDVLKEDKKFAENNFDLPIPKNDK